MPHRTSNLTAASLTRFKEAETDENRQIAKIVAELVPKNVSGIVLDIGAGVGDIIRDAAPDRDCILIDILDFPPPENKRHVRRTCDFFDLQIPPQPIDIALMSHVLQYLDDDIPRLVASVRALNPNQLIIVVDVEGGAQEEALNWLRSRGVKTNPERPVPGFPPKEYLLLENIRLNGNIRMRDYQGLADRVARFVFDAVISDAEVSEFATWLQQRLSSPELIIPQAVQKYRKRVSS